MAYNPLHKLQDNTRALRVALAVPATSVPTTEELRLLRSYSGFGGIKAVLYGDGDKQSWLDQGATEADLRLWEPMQDLYQLLKSCFAETDYATVKDSLKNSVLTAFYTPPIVPESLFGALNDQGIYPSRIYEPSAGAGIFLSEAVKADEAVLAITAVEKDVLTGKVLSRLASAFDIPATVHITGLEQAPTDDNGRYDLIVSNIPFGNFSVFDRDYPEKYLSGRIHNYFFAKGLDKIGNGGLLAFITTDGFLNSPGNREARNYLFTHSDFVSLTVMPDNLMNETGGTEAPSHLLIVQKNDQKTTLYEREKLLLDAKAHDSDNGVYYLNEYINTHIEVYIGSDISIGLNQYGKAHIRAWQENIASMQPALIRKLKLDMEGKFKKSAFEALQLKLQQANKNEVPLKEKPRLTYLPMPEAKEVLHPTAGMQLGLFDVAPIEYSKRTSAYLKEKDKDTVLTKTARISCTIRTTDQPEHELIVLLTAKAVRSNSYIYRLSSNVREISYADKWLSGKALATALEALAHKLTSFGHEYIYEGDGSLKSAFLLSESAPLNADNIQGLPPFYKENALYVHCGNVGYLKDVDNDSSSARLDTFAASKQQILFYQKYIAVRDAYFELFQKEQVTNQEAPGLRISLNAAYDSFLSNYGPLNKAKNKIRILNDEAFGFITLSSVERKEGELFVPSDILNGYLAATTEDLTTDNVNEALAFSLNKNGEVDLAYIAALTKKEEYQVIHELGENIYYNPMPGNWETANRYLSGNVLEKLRQAENALEKESEQPQLLRSYEAIKTVQPRKIAFELLDFNFGERWIPTDYYSRFVTSLFELDSTVFYLHSMDAFKVKVNGSNALIKTEYAIHPKNGHNMYGATLVEHALENTNPFFSYTEEMPDGTTRKRPDNEATQLAFSKIEAIRAAFTHWLSELPKEEKQKIEDLYNEKYNCYVLRKYDGSHLTFPGLDLKALGIEALYPSQKDAAWRIIEEKGALIDHMVGLGKTLTMIIAAQEMKRLGIVNKPMILGLKANVPEIAATYRKAYPTARILYPGQRDFTPKNRQRIFHEIKNNNWDCVILSHNQFEALEQSPEIQKAILEKELNGLVSDLQTLKSLTGDKLSKQDLKGLEVRKVNLSAKLNTVTIRLDHRRDHDIDFKTMAIDMLFVDESHKYKNLTFTTRHTRVAGLGNPQGSQRALNMLFAVRTLQQRYDADKGVTFLSGTPISNSLTELYLIFKYLRPRALERLGMSHFDGWAAVHARKTVDFEFSVTNEIISKERFRHFIKVPELALFYNEITDYKTDKHIRQDKPELEEVLVHIKPTAEQQEFIGKLIEFARTGNAHLIGLPPLSGEEDKARMLIATNLAKKMAVDMRLVNPYLYSDDPGSKISQCARKFAEIYHQGEEHKVAQIIFCDIGTPKPNQFNIYDALRNKLVGEYGIPEKEIAFIHEWEGAKRFELFRKVNAGEIRGLIGSTEKAGTGLNVQQRLIAEHDLDVPWTPKDMEQRTGRMQRTGNIIAKKYYGNKVTAYRYATEKSLDNYKFNLLKNKQTFIAQLKNNELQVRTLDEGAMDDKTGMNFSEYVAILSGDTSLLEKSKQEKKVTALENLKAVHYNQIAEAKWETEHLRKEKEKAQTFLDDLLADQKVYQKELQYTKEGVKANPLKLEGCADNTPEGIGRHLIQLFHNWQPGQEPNVMKIGKIYGFDCFIEHIREWSYRSSDYVNYNKLYAQRESSAIKYTYNQGTPNESNPKLATRYFLEAIDRVGSLCNQHEIKIANFEKNIRQLELMIDKPFEGERKLSTLKEELASLERKIAIGIEQAKMEKEEGDLAITPTDDHLEWVDQTELPENNPDQKNLAEPPPQQSEVIPLRRPPAIPIQDGTYGKIRRF